MRGTRYVRPLAAGALLAAAGCSGYDGTNPSGLHGSLRVIHAAGSSATLDVLVDGGVVINGLATGTVSSAVSVPSGQRTIAVRPAGGVPSPKLLHLYVGADSDYTALAATGYEIGLVAIAVGWMVGLAVHKGSNGAGGWPYQTIAVGLTYLAIVSTYLPFIFKGMNENAKPTAAASAPASDTTGTAIASPAQAQLAPSPVDSATASRSEMTVGKFLLGVLALIAIAAVAPFLAGFENVIGLVIIGFALYQAWKMNRRVPLVFSGPYAVRAASGGAAGGE